MLLFKEFQLVTVDKKTKASRPLKIVTLVLVLIQLLLAIFRAELEGISNAIPYGIGTLLSPFFIILLLQLFKRFRNQRSRYIIYCIVIMLVISSNSLIIIQKSGNNLSQKQQQIQIFISKLKPQLPYDIPSNGFTMTEISSPSGEDIVLNVTAPVYMTDFEDGGETIFLDNQKAYLLSNYCSKQAYTWLKELSIPFTINYHALDEKLIGSKTVISKDCD